MANELYIYTTPSAAQVTLHLDDGRSLPGVPVIAEGRGDAHLVQLPSNTPVQGGVLEVLCADYTPFSNRGRVIPSMVAPAVFELDDVRLSPVPVPPSPPAPPDPTVDPEAIVSAVYHLDTHDLETKEGCGTFTEACCDDLHAQHSADWGHIRKPDPGQNQWNGHAVDALYLRWPTPNCPAGVYDIIHDSESPNASAVFNYKGETDPALWYYPA